MYRRWVPIFILLCASHAASHELPFSSDSSRLPTFLSRFGVHESWEDPEVRQSPVRINRSIIGFKENGERRLITDSDFHYIVDIPMRKIVWVLTQHQTFHEFYRRIVMSEDLTPESGPFDFHRQRAVAVAKAFGIEKSYDYLLNIHTSGDDTREFFQKWNLERSLDDRLYAVYGSWYLKPVEIGGKEYTYMRYFYCSGFKEVPAALEMVMKSFMDMDIRKVMRETANAAETHAP